MRKVIYIFSFVLIATFTACDDNEFNDVFKENLAPIPVNFPGSTLTADAPTFELSLVTSQTINIPMEIPASTGVTITEIDAVAAGTIAINAGTLSSANFLDAPLAVGGNSYEFTTTIDDLNAHGLTADETSAGATIAFIFRLVLSDGQILISREVEVDIVE